MASITDLTTVEGRIETFKEWENAHVTKEKLAAAGFFRVPVQSRDVAGNKSDDIVECYQCGGKLGDWEAGDDPKREHDRWFRDCPSPAGRDIPPTEKYRFDGPSKPEGRDIPPTEKYRFDGPSKPEATVTLTVKRAEVAQLMKMFVKTILAEIEDGSFLSFE